MTAPVGNWSRELEQFLVPLATIYRDPGNLNAHSELSITEIGNSLREFGQQTPIKINSEGMIVKGNGTHEAAEALGWTHIAATRFEGNDVEQLRYAIADNLTARHSQMREKELVESLKTIGGKIPGLPQKMEDALIAAVMKSGRSSSSAFDVIEAMEANPDSVRVCEGEIWQLGRHFVMCGDATSEEALTNLLTTSALSDVSLVISDPPYGINAVRSSGQLSGRGRKSGKLGFGDQVSRPFGGNKTLLAEAMGNAPRAERVVAAREYMPVIGDETTDTAERAFVMLNERFPRAVQVWWGANHYGDVVPASPCWIVWNKVMTGTFADCELAWTNQTKAVKMFTHQWNGMLRASEQRTPRVHPNQKPVALAAWLIETFGTEESTVVLDPFSGSFWSLWAAEACGATSLCIEMSPEYCSVAVNKWEAITGLQADKRFPSEEESA